jgi:pilus assembly protein CpaB
VKFNNRFVFGIISILVAAVIAFIAIPALNRQANSKTEIIRVTRPIRKGTVITSRDIEKVEVGGYNLPADVIKDSGDVIGKYASADLVTGDYILQSKISGTPVTSDIQLSDLPPGKVAVSFTVKSLASGLSDKLQSGDVIRMYHFNNFTRDVPELQYVLILSVTDSRGVNVDYSQDMNTGEEKRQSATVTVLASPEQAKKIIEMENSGLIHVVLVCRHSDELAGELLTEQEDILNELYPLRSSNE